MVSSPGPGAVRSLQANSNLMAQTTFQIIPVAANGVTVVYNTLSANNPSRYGNQVAVWQNPNFIPWTQRPLKSVPVSPGTTPYGTVFLPFTIGVGQSFIIAYQVGFGVGSACATAFLPAGGNPDPCQSSTLGVVVAQTNNVILSYALPFGSTPQTFGHWVGVWEGPVAYYSTQNLFAQAKVTSNSSSDIVNIPLARPLKENTTYTAAYFAGAQPTNMAVTCTFVTGT